MSKKGRAITYIDGFNLYNGMMDSGLGNYRWINYLHATKLVLGNMIRIYYGRFQLFPSECNICQTSPLYCANCGAEYKKPNEKKTDVNIATSMLVDCFEDNTDAIILVSGDSDYTAPLDEIGRLFPNIERIITFPPSRKNGKLYNHCDQHFSITSSHFAGAGLLPQSVTNPRTGTVFAIPSSWK
ncbi:MAG: NYN domain-containing protein [Chloroflexi bacterium]|nr:NYN domain-containing protein [Chloroflexota bacterium]